VEFGRTVLFGVLLAGCFAWSETASSQPPNIVFYLSDDLGYGDLGCYGHPYAKTPNLDKLAKEGTLFEQHYATGVTCNPSRTGLMSGLFPARFQKYCADFGLSDRTAITDLLKKRGYTTGHFGKWHMGPDSMATSGTYGLDVVKEIGVSNGNGAGDDDDLTTAAIEFMKENAGKKPFYVNIWGHSTHFPVSVPPELSGEFMEIKVKRSDFSKTMQHKFDECVEIGGNLDDSMRQYLGDVYSVDRNVARVLKAIDELGIRGNTLFVYSSDQGPAPIILGKGVREFSNNMLGYAGELSGGKHEQLEGGVRVPFIIRWPGHVPAGRVDSEDVVSFIDWMPTLASIAGIKELPGQLDGEDVSDIWLGKSRPRTKPLFWKVSSTGSSPAIRDGKWKLHLKRRGADDKIELFDLSKDPSESRNVSEKYPDVVADLKAKLDAWTSELPDSYEKATKNKDND
jgi:N-acetylgalactosamine-6-sulfatase